jgi:lysophospholipase L1-like esterase
MGRWAGQMNTVLAGHLAEPHARARRTLHRHPASTTSAGMAADGMHPSPAGYAVWADGLSRHILTAQTLPGFSRPEP